MKHISIFYEKNLITHYYLRNNIFNNYQEKQKDFILKLVWKMKRERKKEWINKNERKKEGLNKSKILSV